jgi:hypothetical protein
MKSQEIREVASAAEFREMLMPWIEEDRKRREAEPEKPGYARVGFDPEYLAEIVTMEFLNTLPKKYVISPECADALLFNTSLKVAQPIPAKVVLATLKKMKTIVLR